ncbi:hypothetical protein OA251_03695 [Prochlorococcus sp. AH-716-P08]|nr:hypothetical protein [Prochlorococcus sp. AH-716-P08]
MKIKKVKNPKELLQVILFLKSAFGWSNQKAINLNRHLLKNNENFGIYGYSIKNNNNNLLGALLIFYQGKLKYKNKELPIVNMSSWYVAPEMRGYGSLKMIKNFINDYSDYLITNITSNVTAYKILKAFGFKDYAITNQKFTILSLINNINFFSLKLYIFLFNNFSLNAYHPKPRWYVGNSYEKKYHFEESSLNLVLAPTIWEKKLGHFHFKIRGTRILYSSNSEIFSKYFYYIFFLNFLRNFSLFTTTHCSLEIPKRNQFKSTKQIYLAPYEDFKSNIELALGSELAFI